jgi:hypothetical protein
MLALSLVACRQLTGPLRNETVVPKYILARGQVLGVNGVPITNGRVQISPQSPNDSDFDLLQLEPDENGCFEIQLPNIPYTLRIGPPSSYNLPDLNFAYVQFQDGVRQTFAYSGHFYSGVVELAGLAQDYSGGNVYFSRHVRVPGGSYHRETYNEKWDEAGAVQIYLPEEGNYEVRVTSCCPNFSYEWPDSLELTRGDTFRLEPPVISHELRLTLGGAPLPTGGGVSVDIRNWENTDSRLQMNLPGDGQKEVFELLGLSGLSRCSFHRYTSPGSVVSDATNPLNFLPQNYLIPPLQDGSVSSFELGQYELEISLLDPQGLPVASAEVRLESEIGLGSGLVPRTDEQGRVVFRVNPGGCELRIYPPDPYEYVHRFFTVAADTQMVLSLQPASQKEAIR